MQDFSKATFLQVPYSTITVYIYLLLSVNKNMRKHLFLHAVFRTCLDLEGLSLAACETILEFVFY